MNKTQPLRRRKRRVSYRISAVTDGDAWARVEAHLASCEICRSPGARFTPEQLGKALKLGRSVDLGEKILAHR